MDPMPVLAVVQLPPPLVLLKTPPMDVPAYRLVGAEGSMARAWITVSVRPVLMALQLSPPSVLLKTPPPRCRRRAWPAPKGSMAKL